MNSRETTYLSIILIGFILGHALPFFEFMGVTPFMLFLGLFLEYFGKKKIVALLSLAFCWRAITGFPWLYELCETMRNAVALPYDSLFIIATVYSLSMIMNLTMLFGIHRALKKIGVYNRIEF